MLQSPNLESVVNIKRLEAEMVTFPPRSGMKGKTGSQQKEAPKLSTQYGAEFGNWHLLGGSLAWVTYPQLEKNIDRTPELSWVAGFLCYAAQLAA